MRLCLLLCSPVFVVAFVAGDATKPPSAQHRRARAPAMGIMQDAEKWITDNIGPITKSSGMGGGSGWASLARYRVEGCRCELVVKASASKPLEG